MKPSILPPKNDDVKGWLAIAKYCVKNLIQYYDCTIPEIFQYDVTDINSPISYALQTGWGDIAVTEEVFNAIAEKHFKYKQFINYNQYWAKLNE